MTPAFVWYYPKRNMSPAFAWYYPKRNMTPAFVWYYPKRNMSPAFVWYYPKRNMTPALAWYYQKSYIGKILELYQLPIIMTLMFIKYYTKKINCYTHAVMQFLRRRASALILFHMECNIFFVFSLR